MWLRESKVRAAMTNLADGVRRDVLEIVAKHLEDKAVEASYTSHDESQTWLAAAREVRAIATNAEFNSITDRIQP